MKKTVIINRAVPGSGKTTISNCVLTYLKALDIPVKIHSTDEFFLTEDGRYVFDKEKLCGFHQLNFLNFEKSLRSEKPVVICDNTNLIPWQTVPYTDAARKWGYQILFVTFVPRGLEKHVQSQMVTPEKPDAHGVSREVLIRFIDEYETYNVLLNRTEAIDQSLHKNYEWDLELNSRVESEKPCPHFDLDKTIVIQPDEYHNIKRTIGSEIYKFMENGCE